MNDASMTSAVSRAKIPSDAPTTNGVRLDSFERLVEAVRADAGAGMATFRVATGWTGGTRTNTKVESWRLGGREEARFFSIPTDEPAALCGTASAPNPQEVLFAALNSCMMVGYVALCAARGIELESLEIRTEGTLDLRGFLGLDPSVKPGYEDVSSTVRIKGTGSEQQFLEVHRAVQATSPNFWNLTAAVACRPALIVD